jgi:very-short-patch-repair endonuclease
MKQNMTSGVVALQYVDDYKKRQCRELRQKSTKAELIFWQALRNRKIQGLKFRRQQVIEGFIVDFYCEEMKLVIELDGSAHENIEQQKIDDQRKRVFERRGLSEIRFSNDEIVNNLPKVIEKIAARKVPSPGGVGIQG